MQSKRTAQRVIRHIAFSEEDDACVRQRATAVGMQVSSFIRCEALNGTVKVYDTTILYNHTIVVNNIANNIKECIGRTDSNRLLYEADLERIEDAVSELVKTEQSLLNLIRQELKK